MVQKSNSFPNGDYKSVFLIIVSRLNIINSFIHSLLEKF